MELSNTITKELFDLRETFVSRGFDIRLVGGVVRDLVRGVSPKDIDLCTDANPDEQIEIYKAANVPYYETGIAHGTISVRIGGETYEITSLRTESDHDGRHASVAYTRDWIDDLGRRDLTFNAMSLTFDGVLIDPFNGVEDLNNNVVRFVGDPSARMREDYLRILRWMRFHGRFAANQPLDAETVKAAVANAEGLRGISRERVWMEVSKIISGEGAVALIQSMYDLGIAENIGLPLTSAFDNLIAVREDTRNPVTLMFALLGDAVVDVASTWKWSSEERDLGIFLAKNHCPVFKRIDWATWFVAVDGHPKHWVSELVRVVDGKTHGDQFEQSMIPVFPLAGRDLLDQGMKPGKQVGQVLLGHKMLWANSGFTMTKEDLLNGDYLRDKTP